MNAFELRRLSELRSLLEGFAARHAAQHIAGSPEELGRLRSILKRLTKAQIALVLIDQSLTDGIAVKAWTFAELYGRARFRQWRTGVELGGSSSGDPKRTIRRNIA